VTCVVIDEGAVPPSAGPVGAVSELRSRFPSLALVLVARPETDPYGLLRLGRAGIDGLMLLRLDDFEHSVAGAVAAAQTLGTEALVTRAISPYLPVRVVRAVREALEGVQRHWDSQDLASRCRLSRPHLSVCLKAAGLPSAGHLLVWSRMLHAGRWLTDPARSAESVSRQLEYSSGAAFRRALKAYTAATPTEVVERGGFAFVLDQFLLRCGLVGVRPGGLSVA
jgi:AraC-like DNA-binding protein